MKYSTIDTALYAARTAGDFLKEKVHKLLDHEIEQKAEFDFVTQTDKESENLVVNIIKSRHPGHQFLAEEGHRDQQSEYRWIIDPLDGTTNFIHRVPVYSVSIALQHHNEIVLGVVYDPNQKECFAAEKGGGAFLNDERVRVSDISDPSRALLATGYPFRTKELIDIYLQSFKNLFQQFSGIRRAGSAAMDLCYVACGRYDGFWELNLKPWDFAAAQRIILEAGGKMTDFAGGDQWLETGNIIAANSRLYKQFSTIIQHSFKGVVDR